MGSYQDWLQQLKADISEITVDQLAACPQEQRRRTLVLDVRERDEWVQGFVPGAVHLTRGFLELRIEGIEPDRQREILCYCGGGVRSLFAAAALKQLGYQRVSSLAGGFRAWKDANQEIQKPTILSDQDRARYARHLSIPEVGEEGQLRLLQSRVLLVGAGGLGCPAAFYLAAAGVGHLGVVDADVVDASNLQRQILHTEDREGMAKVDSAEATLKALNSKIEIKKYPVRLNRENVDEIFQDYEVIVDGSDNFPTRYLVNDACVKHELPNVHGSVFRFDGQCSVFWPRRGPCYRCLYAEPPPPELAPSCAEAGVLGILPGVIGLLEAVETIKILLNIGTPLVGRLLVYDALETSFHEMKVRRNPKCPVCADSVEFPGYIDYQGFCQQP